MGAKGESETRLVFSFLAVSSSSLIYWIIFAIIFDALKFPALFSFAHPQHHFVIVTELAREAVT